jgi:hypothetical protein
VTNVTATSASPLKNEVVTPATAKHFLDAELAATGKTIQELGIQPE